MRASVSMAGDALAFLRHRISEIESGQAPHDKPEAGAPSPFSSGSRLKADRPARSDNRLSAPLGAALKREGLPAVSRALESAGQRLCLGVASLDQRLAGGLRRDGLHEIRGGTARDASAASGFAIALLARLLGEDHRPVLYVTETSTVRDGGILYRPGLAGFGFDPRRLVVVRAGKTKDVLWAGEEGLRCRGLAAVLIELRGAARLDLTASRRLALRAGETGVMGLLLRQAGDPDPGAVLTRWHVMPSPADPPEDFPAGLGRPAWRLHLERNRQGRTGAFHLEWDHDRHAFALAEPARPAHPRARSATSFDRPDPAPESGEIMALRRAS